MAIKPIVINTQFFLIKPALIGAVSLVASVSLPSTSSSGCSSALTLTSKVPGSVEMCHGR